MFDRAQLLAWLRGLALAVGAVMAILIGGGRWPALTLAAAAVFSSLWILIAALIDDRQTGRALAVTNGILLAGQVIGYVSARFG